MNQKREKSALKLKSPLSNMIGSLLNSVDDVTQSLGLIGLVERLERMNSRQLS